MVACDDVRIVRRRPRAILAAVLLCACGSADREPGAGAEPAGAAARADSVSLDEARAIADAVTVPVLFERLAEPERFLTDFFGAQPLRPLTEEGVLAALVPDQATVVSREPGALTLDLVAGPRVTFRFDTRLVINGNPVDVPWARVVIREPATYPAEPVRFRDVLAEAGLDESWLVPNPYYAAEQAVSLRMRAPETIDSVIVRPDTAGFGATPHAVLVVGETHGGTEAYDRARALLGSASIDWIGIEMLAEDLQPALDRYLTNGDAESRALLLDYYRANWNTRGHEITTDPADNPYFRLIETARTLGKPIFALDTEASYILFRFGEFPLGATVRDFTWASNVPESGRGVVYGGSSHFLQSRRPNMLTFLRERFPDVGLFGPGI